MHILTTEPREYAFARERFSKFGHQIYLIKGGIWSLDAAKRLNIPQMADVMVFGFAAGSGISLGAEVWVDKIAVYAPSRGHDVVARPLRPDIEGAPKCELACYTTPEIPARKPNNTVEGAVLFDRELALIATIFPRLTAWKIVTKAIG